MSYYYEVMLQYSKNQIPADIVTNGSVELHGEIASNKMDELLPAVRAKYAKPGFDVHILRTVPLTKEQYDAHTDNHILMNP